MTKIPTLSFDAVIIGGGGAGMRASLQLAKTGKRVAVISKVFPTRSHTVSAQGGINAALGNMGQDDWRWHMYDTVQGSDYLGDQDAIEYMCKHAPETVIELEQMGLPFSRIKNGKIYQRSFGGQTLNYGGDLASRTCCAADRTGHALLHTLYQQNLKEKANFLSEWFAIDLVKSNNGSVIGVIAIEMETGDVVFIQSSAVILATGGAGRIFKTTTNAHSNTGDGLAMALRAGFPLEDMEFWQFHPTGIAGAGCLVTEGCRGEGGYLVNGLGERYMERYAPHLKDLSCRDVVSRSSLTEIKEGRGCGPNKDYVYLKLDHLGADIINSRLPTVREAAITFAGVDPVKDPIPVVPTCHYLMGGIPTNPYGQVITLDAQGRDHIVPGLYAAGECACVSVHGSNRLGANSLLDILVFGRSAGIHLTEALEKGDIEPQICNNDNIDEAMQRYRRLEENTQGEDVATLRAEMQNAMSLDFGVFREENSMLNGLEKIKVLAERVNNLCIKDKSKTFNTDRIEALELQNLMDVAKSTAVLAQNRKESRGAHSRPDYPDRNDKEWFKHSIYFLEGDRIAYRPVNMSPKEVPPFPLKERDH